VCFFTVLCAGMTKCHKGPQRSTKDPQRTAKDSGAQVDVIYTDFAKAFDTVPHGRLLTKLKSYNISDKLIAWIQDFLYNRIQSICVNGEFSAWFDVLSGIPQGSMGHIYFRGPRGYTINL